MQPTTMQVDAAMLRPTLCLSSLGSSTAHTFGGTATAPSKVHTNKMATLLANGITEQMVEDLMGPAVLTGNLATSAATWQLGKAGAAARALLVTVPTTGAGTSASASVDGSSGQQGDNASLSLSRSKAALPAELAQQYGKLFGASPHPHRPAHVYARQYMFRPVAPAATADDAAVGVHHSSSSATQRVESLKQQGLAMAQAALAQERSAARAGSAQMQAQLRKRASLKQAKRSSAASAAQGACQHSVAFQTCNHAKLAADRPLSYIECTCHFELKCWRSD
jgi:hypothetical protein